MRQLWHFLQVGGASAKGRKAKLERENLKEALLGESKALFLCVTFFFPTK